MTWTKPGIDDIRSALKRYAPFLAGERVEFLAEGWSLWSFRAGTHVLRFPKAEHDVAQLEMDRRLLPELAHRVSFPIPAPDVYDEHSPSGAPFAGHRMLPGISLIRAGVLLPATARGGQAEVRLAPRFGRALGVLLRELHSFPAQRALGLGVKLLDGPAVREARRLAGRSPKRRLSLVNDDVRSYIDARFHAYLDDPANFDFEPRLVHGDFDRQNVLVDPRTGTLTGVIDFGAVNLGKPAFDFLLPLGDFDALGIAEQLDDFLEAYGSTIGLERARTEVEFIMRFLWPLYDMTFGFSIGNAAFVEAGKHALQKMMRADAASK